MKSYLFILFAAFVLSACGSSGTKDNYNDHAVPDGDLPISTGSQDTTLKHPADSAAVQDSVNY
ncbi:membrane lipoprotein lipid attachment site-containing protein [Olivibacter sitiensis]|uniref:membrane lipoprotein lipid attachment site-containing protein n=1 Tax=Olivibacter sitiensis TaxID=376470 RepID=UPI0004295832|nr:membrane lipoprotein lipid attachment site-containing protein [Olivibacter sitiensis]